MALQECVKCKGISMIMLDEQFQRFCGWKMTYPEYMIGNLEVLDQMARNKKLLPWPIVITSITLAVWFQQVLQQCQRSLPFLHKTTYVSKKMLRIVDGMFVMRIENNTSNSVFVSKLLHTFTKPGPSPQRWWLHCRWSHFSGSLQRPQLDAMNYDECSLVKLKMEPKRGVWLQQILRLISVAHTTSSWLHLFTDLAQSEKTVLWRSLIPKISILNSWLAKGRRMK